MNKLISQIILGFTFITFLVVLSFYTFFWWEKKELDNHSFNITKLWEKKIDWVISDKINLYATIYSKNKDYKVSWNKITFWTWIYLIDSRDFFSTFTLDMWNDKVLLKWGWIVYINNNPENKTIFSFNNKVEIQFINKITKLNWIEVYLYPHMYLKFRPYRFEKLPRADTSRVWQLWILKYFNWDLIDLSKWNNLYFVKNENKIFLEKTILDILDKQKKYSIKFEKLKNNNLFNLNSSDFLEKYFSLFYNDRKKTVYYKNKILKLLIKLLNENKQDNKTINDILSDLKWIKDINIYEYKNTLNFIKNVFYLSSYNLVNNSDIIQNNYNLLIYKIFKINNIKEIELIKDVDKYNYLWDFTKYLKLTILDIENKNLTLLDKQYYILFKKNILISNFSNLNIEQKYFDILLKGFISYSENIEKNITVEEKDNFIINVKNNIDILEKLSKSLRVRYFKEKRNSQNLLVFKDSNNIIPNIKLIKKSIEDIFKKFNKAKNTGYLKKRDNDFKNTIIRYKITKSKLEEYTNALENYFLYKKQYSKINEVLSWVEVYKDKEDKLSREKFLKYIKNFNWIELNSIDYDVENYFYKINNISISWRQFSFDLYPYNWNIIKNISYNDLDYKNNLKSYDSKKRWFYNHLESTSYSLDNEKEKYKELFLKAKEEEKEKYDFRNFFLNTFFLLDTKKTVDFNKYDTKINKDDEIIQTFKRAKLLWNKWEFRDLSDILNINYFNLDVKVETLGKFQIKIVNSKFNIDIKNWNKTEKYLGTFNSNYNIEDGKHYFYNIKLKPYIKRNSADKEYIFDNLDLKIIWKIKISDFRQKMKDIFTKIPDIKSKYLENKKEWKVREIIYNMIIWKYYIKK